MAHTRLLQRKAVVTKDAMLCKRAPCIKIKSTKGHRSMSRVQQGRECRYKMLYFLSSGSIVRLRQVLFNMGHGDGYLECLHSVGICINTFINIP